MLLPSSHPGCLYFLNFQTLLWRGHYRMTLFKNQFLLPLNSATAFFWGVLVSWDFNRFPSFLLFSVAWAFLVSNGHVNQHPSPWHRCRAYVPQCRAFLTGKNEPQTISPYHNVQEAIDYEKAIERRELEIKRELELTNMNRLKMRAELGNSRQQKDYTSVVDMTSQKESFLYNNFVFSRVKRVLYPIQLQMRQVITSLRISSSVFLWEEAFIAFWVTSACLFGSFLLFWVRFDIILRWFFRIMVWVFLGPWMKLADQWYYRHYSDLTEEERDAVIRARLRKRYERAMKTASSYQIRKERVRKLQSIKNYMVRPANCATLLWGDCTSVVLTPD